MKGDPITLLLLLSVACVSGLRVPLKKYRHFNVELAARARRLKTATPAQVAANFSEGRYTVDIYLGATQQRQTVQLDTGSGDLAVVSDMCYNCAKHLYSAYTSDGGEKVMCDSTECEPYGECYPGKGALKNTCMYDDSFGDGSGFTALVYTDKLNFENSTAGTPCHVEVGAMVEAHGGDGQGSFEPFNVNGIMGAGFRDIKTTGGDEPNPIFAFTKAGGLPQLFSMCFAPGGGLLGVGEILPFHSGDFVTEPVVQDYTGRGKNGYWSVDVRDVLVAGTSIHTSSFDCTGSSVCIVDSGTTAVQLPQSIFADFKAAVLGLCDQDSALVGVCVDDGGKKLKRSKTIFDGEVFALTEEQLAQYPAIAVQFSEAKLEVEAAMYLAVDTSTGKNLYYSLILEGGEGETIIGDAFLQGFVTVYDSDKMQFEFAPVKGCGSA